MALPTRTQRTTITQPTKRVTVEAKATSTGARSLADKRKVYTAGTTTRVNPKATESKSGAAAYPITEAAKDVASAYGDEAKKFAKIELVDRAVKNLISYLPKSNTTTFLAKIPFVNKLVAKREEAVVKGLIVTVVPTLLVKYAGENPTAISIADAVISLGARDGISVGADVVSTKLGEIYEAFSETEAA